MRKILAAAALALMPAIAIASHPVDVPDVLVCPAKPGDLDYFITAAMARNGIEPYGYRTWRQNVTNASDFLSIDDRYLELSVKAFSVTGGTRVLIDLHYWTTRHGQQPVTDPKKIAGAHNLAQALVEQFPCGGQ